MAALVEKAKSTPVFAPGLSNLEQMGAVHMTWSDAVSLAKQLEALLADMPVVQDRRGALGKERGGRLKAADIAERVRDLALQTR
jgi:malonate decarboxylase gamma subunit